MISSSQSPSNFPTNKKMLLDTREDAYQKQKEMLKHIEIRVSELIEREDPYTEEGHTQADSFVEKNNHPNVSVKILEDYQIKQMPKKTHANSRSREKIKSLSSVVGYGTEQLDHRIGDLFKWQERVNKKHEMQREFQEQIRSSMYDYKVYTNELSNQMLETIRPNAKVENILLLKGQAKQMKIKKMEQQLYGGDRVPAITKMAQRLNKNQNVYNRLYDVDKQRRDKSKEVLSRTQSQTLDSSQTRHRSKSEGRRKAPLSMVTSPNRVTRNFEFAFSPRELPINQTNDTQATKDHILAIQTTVTSPSGFTSPLYSVKNASNNRMISIQQSLNKSNEEIFSPFNPSPANAKKVTERPKTGPMNIYKRLTPAAAPKNPAAQMSQSQQNISENKMKRSPSNLGESVNQQQQNMNHDNHQKSKKNLGLGPSESTPVLPNMLFFKNAERQASSTPTNMNQNIHHLPKGVESHQKEPFDIRSMEVFWEKILQDDSEGRVKSRKSDIYQSEDGHPKTSVADRAKMWVEKKNKKLDNQRKQKEEKELENCTFKPHLQAQEQPTKNMQMYYNFLERISHTKSTTSSSGAISPLYPQQNQQQSKKNGNNNNVEFAENSHGIENGNARYPGDVNLQKKIYNYILNIPN